MAGAGFGELNIKETARTNRAFSRVIRTPDDPDRRAFFCAFARCYKNGSLIMTKQEQNADKMDTAHDDIFGTVIQLYIAKDFL